MRKIISNPHNLLIFTLLFCFFSFKISNDYNKGLIKFEYNLYDGEVLDIGNSLFVSDINDDLFYQDDKKIKNTLPEINSALLRSFETEYITIKDVCKQIDNQEIGYWDITPEKINLIDSLLFEKYFTLNPRKSPPSRLRESPPSIFEEFVHKLFQNKTARTYLFNHTLNYVSQLCEKYPSDFKLNILNELDELLLFTNSLQTNLNKINTDTLEDYWKGFIYRRYVTDKIPLSEIKSSLIIAQSKIKTINTEDQADAMYEYRINKQLVIYISANNYTIYSTKSGKKITFEKGVFIQKIKYLKGDDGEYYQLIGVKASKKYSDGFGPPSPSSLILGPRFGQPRMSVFGEKYPFRKEIQYLYDSNLEKIE